MALLKIVTDRQEISECYGTLMSAFQKKGISVGRRSFDLHGSKRMTDVYEQKLPGKSMRLAVAGIKDKSSHKKKSSYNILVGISSLKVEPVANMDFQLRIPASGINRNDSCAFAKDGSGRIYLVHRGLFFGGKFRMKRDVFFENYEGLVTHANDGAIQTKVAVLGEMSDKKFVEWFAFFLQEAQRISATAPRTHTRKRKPDRKARAKHRAIVKAAIVELNRTLGKVKELDGYGFGLYQPRNSDSATANLEFMFKGESLVFEPTLERDKIAVVLYPRAMVRGRDALATFIDKGFRREMEIISKGEVGYDYDGSTVSYEVGLKSNRGQEKELFVEYANMTVNAIVKTLAKA